MQNISGQWLPIQPQQQVPQDPGVHHPAHTSLPFQAQAQAHAQAQEQVQLHTRPLLQPPMQQPSQPHLLNPPGPFTAPHALVQQPLNLHHQHMPFPLKAMGNNASPVVASPAQYVHQSGKARPPLPPVVKMEPDPTGIGPFGPMPEVIVSHGRKPSVDRQRIRVNRACDRCRLHKIKCTGLHPCVNCSKQGTECVIRSARTSAEPAPAKKRRAEDEEASSSPQSKTSDTSPMEYTSGRSDDSPSKPKQAASGGANVAKDEAYTTYLENRVQYLEHLVARNTTEAGPGLHPKEQRLKDLMDILTPTLTKWKVARRVQGALAIQLCQTLYDSLSEEVRQGLSVPRTNHYGWNMSGCNYMKLEGLPPVPRMDDICLQRQSEFLDFFFREINPIYAILHESVFREQYEAFQKLQSDEPASNNTALFRAMIFLVFAMSIRFREFMKPNGPSMQMLQLEESLFKYSYETVQLFSQEWESFELIQCWLLTTLYLRITQRQTSCFFALGNAVNMCRGMGLGKYESIIPDIKPYTKLKAERIFFSVYIFDRIIGLQGGRFRALSDVEITRTFPLLENITGACSDGWNTLPALAMVHMARLSNFMEIAISNDEDRSKAELIEREFLALDRFLDRAGFNSMDDSSGPPGNFPAISPMVKAQVRLHYGELVVSVHGKGLFTYLGQNVSIEGINTARVFEANKMIIATFQKIEELNYLNAPWYLTLTSLLSVGITCLVYMHVQTNLGEAKQLLNEAVAFLKKLKNTPVRDEDGKLVFRQRFKMVEECIWLIKMINHFMILSFEQSIKSLADLGIDHGSSAVNKRLFLQFGWDNTKPGGLDMLMNQRSHSEGENARPEKWDSHTSLVMDSSPESCVSQPKGNTVAAEEFLENFAWFEQWMDSGQDI